MGSSLPNEIFAKILGHLKPKASHRDMENLEKAIDHPDLCHLLPTLDYFTSRSRPDRFEEGNFICPICLFAQREIFSDSIWDTLCESLFGSSFILHGGYGLVQTRAGPFDKKPSKRKHGEAAGPRPYWINFLYSEEFLMSQSRRRQPVDEFCQSYARRIQLLKNKAEIIRLSEIKMREVKIFTKVGEFIDHVHECESHFDIPQITINSKLKTEFPSLNFDALYQSKIKEEPIHKFEDTRCVIGKLVKDRSGKKITDIINLKQPTPTLFDVGSRNSSFVEFIIWPALTFALSIQLEDHINYPTSQFKSHPKEFHKVLALRDLLTCMCEIFEKLDYDFEPNRWMKAKFAAYHGILEILDSFFDKY